MRSRRRPLWSWCVNLVHGREGGISDIDQTSDGDGNGDANEVDQMMWVCALLMGREHTREMQVPHRELRALDVNWQVDLAATGQILDIAVPAMLRTTGDCPGTFFPDFCFGFLVGGTRMDTLWLRGLGDDA